MANGTPATVLLSKQKVEHSLHTYEVSPETPNYGAVVAEAIGADPARVFKTLITTVDGALTVAVVPVTGELDLKALASAVGGKKGALAERAAAEKATGYVRGGISPLGQRTKLTTVIDASALDADQIFVSAGRRGLQVRLAPEALVRLTAATVAEIAKG
ncbi:Cys-tRNA(Pro)/Cys-tRNA(Cys) deacylase [Allocatelliglobosispora scoriae]|uniref:Cys-tRNA(Pro)/Cys-tRNA(Cys) deacylase n=1 Tax=Allocatelliglobosispora scoriae TaxID=643052 RepID=A0A841BVP5_9ACTN|nr:Cys-tRNA(Pro) deacylase [Allocatelliglobosispora scoriae]MBB5871546.1 Cys-tRNA(Pro)/Cys-tRNA(Cys) deacylase [Allocatelliglobosispora scoriae]